jgi:hypothetical protein
MDQPASAVTLSGDSAIFLAVGRKPNKINKGPATKIDE